MTDVLSGDAERVVRALTTARKTVATAESCTGGWIAKVLTDVAGSSAVFGYGIVSYSNAAKRRLLGIDESTIAEHGAVSEAVVRDMASGVRRLAGSDLSVAVSGIAGPGGGSADKPVGTIWFAWATGDKLRTDRVHFDGDREQIRVQTVRHALEGICDTLS